MDEKYIVKKFLDQEGLKKVFELIKENFESKSDTSHDAGDLERINSILSDIQDKLSEISTKLQELDTVDERIQNAIDNMPLKTVQNYSLKGNGNLNLVGIIVRDQTENEE